MLTRVLAMVAVALVLVGILLYSQWREPPLVISGFVEADDVRVGSRVGGRVARVLVEEGQAVQAGAVLLELAAYDVHERRAEAAAQLAAREAELDRLRSGFREEEIAQARARRDQLAARLQKLRAGPRSTEISAAESRHALAQAQLELARSTYDRVKASFDRSAASADELDRATDALKTAQATLEVRRQELAELREGTRREEIAEAEAQLREAEAALALMAAGYRRQDIAAAEAAVESARAAVAAIDRQIEELKVVSPVAGTVESIELEPGDLVAANAPALSVLDASRLWVRAYVPENRLSLRVGQRVPVRVDAFPGRRFMGRITFIARDAEFTPGNVQTPEERSKQVFRIKVTIEQGLNVLRPGMAADVLLDEARPANEPGLGSEAKPGGEAGPESEAEPENEPGPAGAAA